MSRRKLGKMSQREHNPDGSHWAAGSHDRFLTGGGRSEDRGRRPRMLLWEGQRERRRGNSGNKQFQF